MNTKLYYLPQRSNLALFITRQVDNFGLKGAALNLKKKVRVTHEHYDACSLLHEHYDVMLGDSVHYTEQSSAVTMK